MSLINKLVIDTLKPLGVPVGFQKYSGAEATYITFHEYLQSGEEFEEDVEAFTGHYVQVDIWTKTDSYFHEKDEKNQYDYTFETWKKIQ